MKFTYIGEGERVFPTISVVAQSGDTFDALDDFNAPDVTSENKPKISAPTETNSKESE